MENSEPISVTILHPAPLANSTSASQKVSPSGHHAQVPLQNVIVHPSIVLSDENSSSEFSDFELESQTTLEGCVGSDGRFQPLSLPPNYYANPKPFKSSLPNPSTTRSSYRASSTASSSQKSLLAVKTIHSERQNYWKINFLIILLPLIFCGLPVHLLLLGRRRINGTKEWLKQIFLKDPICIRIITICFFLFGLGVNGLFIYIAGGLLYSLTIKGEVRSSIFEDVINIIRVAPVVIPLDVIWICGYAVRKLLISFDRVTYPEIEVEWKIDYGKISKKKKPVKAWKNGWRSMTSYRIRLVAVYFIVIFNQLVHALITYETTKDVTDSSRTFDTWVTFALNFMYNLMLPIHMCLAWAIDWEFQRLSLYIKSLIACKIHPTFEYLAQFKKYYKSVGNHVMSVNDICGGYYSWVLLYLFLSMYNEVYGIIQVIITSFISYILGTVSNGTDLPKANVRLFVGNFFGGLSQVLLIFLTVWFCISANDSARHLHVRLNDFVSEPYVVLTPELYKKFRMLKYYIHSRMETERPALLTIPIVGASPYCSSLYNWKLAYRVRH